MNVVNRVLMSLGFQDAGFTAGVQQATGSVSKFGAETVLGTRIGGTFAGTLGNIGRAFGAAALGAAGMTAGVAGLAVATTTAVREVGEMQTSLVRLKLATGGNVEEFARYRAIVAQTRRGGVFDDNDVATAAAMARVMELNVNEFEQLLPAIRGLAATTPGATLEGVFSDVARAINTGMIRSLIQYGITQDDIAAKSREFYQAEYKDLDELAQRFVTLEAVKEKALFFETGEADTLNTLPGAIRALKVELGELAEETLEPFATALGDVLVNINKLMTIGRDGRTSELKHQLSKDLLRGAIDALPPGIRELVLMQEATKGLFLGEVAGPQTLADYEASNPLFGPNAPPPGGRNRDLEAAKRAAALRARLLWNLEPDRDLVGEEFEAARGDKHTDRERRRAREQHERVQKETEELAAARREAYTQMLQSEERAEEESWIRRSEQAQGVAGGMYSALSRAAVLYYAQQRGHHKSMGEFLAAMAKQELGQHLLMMGAKAAKDAAYAAIKGFHYAADPFTAPLAGAQFAAAAKFAAFAAAEGIGGAALLASGQRAAEASESESSIARGSRAGTETRQRGFGTTFSRPVENLTINVAVAISGTNFIGSDQTDSIADMMEQHAIPAIRDAFVSGKLAA